MQSSVWCGSELFPLAAGRRVTDIRASSAELWRALPLPQADRVVSDPQLGWENTSPDADANTGVLLDSLLWSQPSDSNQPWSASSVVIRLGATLNSAGRRGIGVRLHEDQLLGCAERRGFSKKLALTEQKVGVLLVPGLHD